MFLVFHQKYKFCMAIELTALEMDVLWKAWLRYGLANDNVGAPEILDNPRWLGVRIALE